MSKIIRILIFITNYNKQLRKKMEIFYKICYTNFRLLKKGELYMLNVPIKINNIIDKFVQGVNEILGNRVKKIILYGSYARGDYNNSSDIDIMILTDLTDDEIVKYRREISYFTYDIECEYDFDISLSPLIKNIDKFNYWLETLPFYMNVQKEGVILSEF